MKKFTHLLLLLSSFALADTYSVTVNREDSNIYQIATKEIYIHTNYCYEFVYYEDATLDMWGRTGELTFEKSNQTCSVSGVYADVGGNSGSYSVTVTRKDTNWYEIFGKDLYIKTNLCLSLAIMQEATLDLNASGTGMLYLGRNQSCMVKGVFSRLSL